MTAHQGEAIGGMAKREEGKEGKGGKEVHLMSNFYSFI